MKRFPAHRRGNEVSGPQGFGHMTIFCMVTDGFRQPKFMIERPDIHHIETGQGNSLQHDQLNMIQKT